jgi:hypothetical protein
MSLLLLDDMNWDVQDWLSREISPVREDADGSFAVEPVWTTNFVEEAKGREHCAYEILGKGKFQVGLEYYGSRRYWNLTW